MPLGAKLYVTFVHSVVLYGRENCHAKEGAVIRVLRNNARVVQLISNVNFEGAISSVQLKYTLQLNTMRECSL